MDVRRHESEGHDAGIGRKSPLRKNRLEGASDVALQIIDRIGDTQIRGESGCVETQDMPHPCLRLRPHGQARDGGHYELFRSGRVHHLGGG